eukprot:775738-Alexandrium_andersonii.AAC.1
MAHARPSAVVARRPDCPRCPWVSPVGGPFRGGGTLQPIMSRIKPVPWHVELDAGIPHCSRQCTLMHIPAPLLSSGLRSHQGARRRGLQQQVVRPT